MFCIFMRLWVELFVWQGLIQAENTVYKKTPTWSKRHKVAVYLLHYIAQTENLYSLALQENK